MTVRRTTALTPSLTSISHVQTYHIKSDHSTELKENVSPTYYPNYIRHDPRNGRSPHRGYNPKRPLRLLFHMHHHQHMEKKSLFASFELTFPTRAGKLRVPKQKKTGTPQTLNRREGRLDPFSKVWGNIRDEDANEKGRPGGNVHI